MSPKIGGISEYAQQFGKVIDRIEWVVRLIDIRSKHSVYHLQLIVFA